ncbi:MAG: hypothetical protein WCK26_00745 [Candidatus Saccharibacteria bacterium]
MGAEQDPTLESTINPQELVVQDGENMGNIAANETSTGQVETYMGSAGTTSEEHPFIEGLPVIGAETENESRDALPKSEELQGLEESAKEQGATISDINEAKNNEAYESLMKAEEGLSKAEDSLPAGSSLVEIVDKHHDNVGTDAMAAEVGRRAEAMLDPATSQELKDQVRQAAEAGFRAELEAKVAEKQEAADGKARELLARIQGGTPISEILPESESETLKTDEVESEI